MFRLLVLGSVALTLLTAPANAAISCVQAYKDTEAASKTAIIGPKESAKVGDMLKQADEACKGGKDAESIEILRQARIYIGE